MRSPGLARIVGVLLLLSAGLAFVPALSPPAPLQAEYLQWPQWYVFAFGFLPMNLAHDILHGFFGLWGLIASRNFAAAKRFCRFAFWVFAILFILGCIPITDTFFGAVPIYGWDTLVHGCLALLFAFGGYGRAAIEPEAAFIPESFG